MRDAYLRCPRSRKCSCLPRRNARAKTSVPANVPGNPEPWASHREAAVARIQDVCRPQTEAPLRVLAAELVDILSEIPPAEMKDVWWLTHPKVFQDVKALVENYDLGDGGISFPAEHWKKGEYTRHLIEALPGRFNMLVMLWDKDSITPVHSHGGSYSFVKILSGQASEQYFDNPNNDDEDCEMKLTTDAVRNPGDISIINDDVAVHVLGAPKERFVSLHIYLPGYTANWVWDDDKHSKDKHIGHFGGNFDSLPWNRC